jgi:hypothetical protein
MLFDHYEKRYYYELNNRFDLNKRVMTVITFTLPIFGGGFILFSKIYLENPQCNYFAWFELALVLYVTSLLTFVFFALRSLYNYDYQFFADPISIEDFKADLNEYYKETEHFKNYSLFAIDKFIEKDIKEYLLKQMKDTTSHNFSQNVVKTRNTRYMSIFMLITSVLGIVNLLFALNFKYL